MRSANVLLVVLLLVSIRKKNQLFGEIKISNLNKYAMLLLPFFHFLLKSVW